RLGVRKLHALHARISTNEKDDDPTASTLQSALTDKENETRSKDEGGEKFESLPLNDSSSKNHLSRTASQLFLLRPRGRSILPLIHRPTVCALAIDNTDGPFGNWCSARCQKYAPAD